MKVIQLICLVLSVSALASANCGCLKCCKNCRVVSSPCSPLTVIFRGTPGECERPLPYSVQAPILPPAPICIPREYDYKIQDFPLYKPTQVEPCYEHDIQVQAPVIVPDVCVPALKNLKVRADRVVLPAPPTICQHMEDLPAKTLQLLRKCPQLAVNQVFKNPCRLANPPMFEEYRPAPPQTYCSYRYDPRNEPDLTKPKSRNKRDASLLSHGVHFFFGLLPSLMKLPVHHAVNKMKMQKNINDFQRALSKKQRALTSQKNGGVDYLKEVQKALANQRNLNNRASATSGHLDKEMKLFLDALQTQKPKSQLQYSGKTHLGSSRDALIAEQAKLFLKNLKPIEAEPKAKQELSLLRHLANTLSEIHNIATPKAEKKVTTYQKPLSSQSKAVLLQKLQAVNEDDHRRNKRSIIMGSSEFDLPFFEVKGLSEEEKDEGSEEESQEASEEKELVGAPKYRRKANLYQPPPEEDLLTKSPITYILHTPIRILKKFHALNKEVSPVLSKVPNVLTTSKQYLRQVGKKLKTGVLDIASNLIGDFNHNVHPKYNPFDKYLSPKRRFYRSVPAQYEPNYTLVFKETPRIKNRSKRYILKVVDEDEVQQFLREKLGNFMGDSSGEKPVAKAKKKKDREINPSDVVAALEKANPKKKVVVEKLKSKIIIDNNGRPFMEINGVKRPIYVKKKSKKIDGSVEEVEEQVRRTSYEEGQYHERITDLIEKAKGRLETVGDGHHTEMPIQTIKEKIKQSLHEIDILVHMDFEEYSSICDDLLHLERIKVAIEQDWKQILMEKRLNDIKSKIGLLDKLKDLQEAKNNIVCNIAEQLKKDNKFMLKKLVKLLVQLRKLQCIIQRVVDDFEGRFSTGNSFDLHKEIKLVDCLAALKFSDDGKTRNCILNDLKQERDNALQKEVLILEKLRKVLLRDDDEQIEAQAKILWEMRNIEKLQIDAIEEMNRRIANSQNIKKELKILFDLQKQLDDCEKELIRMMTKQRSRVKADSSADDNEEEEKKVPSKKKLEHFDFHKYFEEKRLQLAAIHKEHQRKLKKFRKGTTDSEEE